MERKFKEYSKPRMVMDRFVPQEFVASCYVFENTPNSSKIGKLRIDLNGNGVVDENEQAYPHLGNWAGKYITNYEIIPMNVYKYARKDRESNMRDEIGTGYNDTYHYENWNLGIDRWDPQYTLVATHMIRSLHHEESSGIYYFIGKVDGVNYGHETNAGS